VANDDCANSNGFPARHSTIYANVIAGNPKVYDAWLRKLGKLTPPALRT
jgi:hypothetical protein